MTPDEASQKAREKLARHCAGIVLVAMAERSADFEYIDKLIGWDSGSTRRFIDQLTDGNGKDVRLDHLSFIMSALDMRLNVGLEKIDALRLETPNDAG
jgi:hypothetical protein